MGEELMGIDTKFDFGNVGDQCLQNSIGDMIQRSVVQRQELDVVINVFGTGFAEELGWREGVGGEVRDEGLLG